MGNPGKLAVRIAEPDSLRQVEVAVSAAGFSSITSYVVDDFIILQFSDALASYPFSEPARLIVGEEFPDGPLIDIAIEPLGRLGELRVGVSLAADYDRAIRISTSFRCVYSDLDSFRHQLEGLIASGGEALLCSSSN